MECRKEGWRGRTCQWVPGPLQGGVGALVSDLCICPVCGSSGVTRRRGTLRPFLCPVESVRPKLLAAASTGAISLCSGSGLASPRAGRQLVAEVKREPGCGGGNRVGNRHKMSPEVCRNPGKCISVKVGVASTPSGTSGGGPLCHPGGHICPHLISAFLWPPR